MTSQRRSLSQALQNADLPVEALAVIEAGKVRPIRERSSPSRSADGAGGEDREERESPVETSVLRETRRPAVEPPGLSPRGLVSLSVRVQASLAECLLKVAFERRLQRQRPHSQQDIVTQAVRQWLKRNGYPTGEE